MTHTITLYDKSPMYYHHLYSINLSPNLNERFALRHKACRPDVPTRGSCPDTRQRQWSKWTASRTLYSIRMVELLRLCLLFHLIWQNCWWNIPLLVVAPFSSFESTRQAVISSRRRSSSPQERVFCRLNSIVLSPKRRRMPYLLVWPGAWPIPIPWTCREFSVSSENDVMMVDGSNE